MLNKRFKVGDKIQRKAHDPYECVLAVGKTDMQTVQVKSGGKPLKQPRLMHHAEEHIEATAMLGSSERWKKIGRCTVSDMKRGTKRVKELKANYKQHGVSWRSV